MRACKTCGKILGEANHVKETQQHLPSNYEMTKKFESDRELSLFLYRMTQEIILSKNFSDSNITRICEKHIESATYNDKQRLQRIVNDLKRQLQIQHDPNFPYPGDQHQHRVETEQQTEELTYCSCGQHHDACLKGSSRLRHDKCISAQSLMNIPNILPSRDMNDSISTITTYDSCSPMASHYPCSSSDSETLIQTILLKHESGAAAKAHSSSTDGSAAILTRMVAADKMFQRSGHRCPLQKCTNDTGQCIGGICQGSDAPILRQQEKDGGGNSISPQASCCGKKKKNRK